MEVTSILLGLPDDRTVPAELKITEIQCARLAMLSMLCSNAHSIVTAPDPAANNIYWAIFAAHALLVEAVSLAVCPESQLALFKAFITMETQAAIGAAIPWDQLTNLPPLLEITSILWGWMMDLPLLLNSKLHAIPWPWLSTLTIC